MCVCMLKRPGRLPGVGLADKSPTEVFASIALCLISISHFHPPSSHQTSRSATTSQQGTWTCPNRAAPIRMPARLCHPSPSGLWWATFPASGCPTTRGYRGLQGTTGGLLGNY